MWELRVYWCNRDCPEVYEFDSEDAACAEARRLENKEGHKPYPKGDGATVFDVSYPGCRYSYAEVSPASR
jgi:hypothetical protein